MTIELKIIHFMYCKDKVLGINTIEPYCEDTDVEFISF